MYADNVLQQCYYTNLLQLDVGTMQQNMLKNKILWLIVCSGMQQPTVNHDSINDKTYRKYIGDATCTCYLSSEEWKQVSMCSSLSVTEGIIAIKG